MGVVGTKVILEPLRYEHITAYLKAFVPVIRSILSVPSLDHEYCYLMQRLQAQYDKNNFFYCVFNRQTNALIGCVEIRDAHFFAGQLYTWLHPAYWSANYFQEAMQYAARDYFMRTHATMITAHVAVTNRRSWRALVKAGFAHYQRIGHYYCLVLPNRY